MIVKQATLPWNGIPLVPAFLRRSDPSSSWCYTASLSPPILMDEDDNNASRQSSYSLPPGTNFLATQVWPSSRTASFIIERHMNPSWTVCELGCGPGLPSLTAAKKGAKRVIATDVDEFALKLVRSAAIEQGFIMGGDEDDDWEKQAFITQQFDLTSKENELPVADLYILSDVFESSAVAEGAAWHVQSLLSKNNGNQVDETNDENNSIDASTAKRRVWVFAQSDRAQRESFLKKMRETYDELLPGWTSNHNPDADASLWLFDLNETDVKYN